MTCNCQKETLKRVTEKLEASANEAEGGKIEGFSADWENKSFILSGPSAGVHVPMKVAYEYQGFKVNGQKKQRLTKDTVSLFMTYCPFCGTEYCPKD